MATRHALTCSKHILLYQHYAKISNPQTHPYLWVIFFSKSNGSTQDTQTQSKKPSPVKLGWVLMICMLTITDFNYRLKQLPQYRLLLCR